MNQPIATQPPAYPNMAIYHEQSNDEVDLVEVIRTLLDKKKIIILITLFGAVLSVVVALLIPKVYKAQSILELPGERAATVLANNGLHQYTRQELFKKYYDKARSQSTLFDFLEAKGLLQKLYPQEYQTSGADEVFGEFVKGFDVEILEPKARDGEFVDKPIRIAIAMMHEDEMLINSIMNQYFAYVGQNLIAELNAEQGDEKTLKLSVLDKEIDMLRRNAKASRLLEIEKIENDNQEKLTELEQKRELLVAKTRELRLTDIFIIQKSNQLGIEELEQKRDLLIEKAKQDRATNIVAAKEALKIANELGIELPTKLDDIKKGADSRAQTSIEVNGQQSLPLYLMGSKYLKIYIDTLEKRKDDGAFLTEVNQIESEIERLKNDKKLEALKNRQSDAPYLKEIKEIENQIEQVKNDVKLAALKARTSDDPYIKQLPIKMDEKERLASLSLDFSGVLPYSLSRKALPTGKAVKPKRALIAIIGTLVGGILAVFYVLVSSALSNGSRRKIQSA